MVGTFAYGVLCAATGTLAVLVFGYSDTEPRQ